MRILNRTFLSLTKYEKSVYSTVRLFSDVGPVTAFPEGDLPTIKEPALNIDLTQKVRAVPQISDSEQKVKSPLEVFMQGEENSKEEKRVIKSLLRDLRCSPIVWRLRNTVCHPRLMSDNFSYIRSRHSDELTLTEFYQPIISRTLISSEQSRSNACSQDDYDSDIRVLGELALREFEIQANSAMTHSKQNRLHSLKLDNENDPFTSIDIKINKLLKKYSHYIYMGLHSLIKQHEDTATKSFEFRDVAPSEPRGLNKEQP